MTASKLAAEWIKLFTTTTKKVNDPTLKRQYKKIDSEYKLLTKRSKATFDRIIHKQISNLMRIKI